VAPLLPLEPPGAQHEPKGQLLGQRALATKDVADYIDAFYNPTRRHSHLRDVSPEHFEASQKPL